MLPKLILLLGTTVLFVFCFSSQYWGSVTQDFCMCQITEPHPVTAVFTVLGCSLSQDATAGSMQHAAFQSEEYAFKSPACLFMTCSSFLC